MNREQNDTVAISMSPTLDPPAAPPGTFREELVALINRHSVENRSDTPDYILAKYLEACLSVWAEATRARDRWYGFNPKETT